MRRGDVVYSSMSGAKDKQRFDAFLLHWISFIVEELINMQITFLNRIIL